MAPADEQAKLKKRLEAILKLADNQVCADCRRRGPRWASANLGVFVCIECSGIHRNLGVHVSFVRSVNLDTWTQKQVDYMEEWGNGRANQYYEANIPSHVTRPKEGDAVRVVEKFIRDKYEYKRYTAESMPPKQSSSQSTTNGTGGGDGGDGVKRMNGSTTLARGESQVVIRQRPAPNVSKPSASASAVTKPAAEAPSLIDFDFAPSVPSVAASAMPSHAPPPVPTMDPFFAPSNSVQQQPQSQFQQQQLPQQQQQHDPFGMQQAPLTWTNNTPTPTANPATAPATMQPSKASANDILSLFASPTNATGAGAPVTTGVSSSMYGGGLNAISAMGSPMAGQGHQGFPLPMGGMMGGGVHMMGSPPPVPMQQMQQHQQHQMMMMQQQQQQQMNAGIRQQPMQMMNMGQGQVGGGHAMMGGQLGGAMGGPMMSQQQPTMMGQPMMGGMNNSMQQPPQLPQQQPGFPSQHMGGGGGMMMMGGGMGGMGGMGNPNQGFPPQHAPPHPMQQQQQQQQQQGMQGYGQGMMMQPHQMNKPFG